MWCHQKIEVYKLAQPSKVILRWPIEACFIKLTAYLGFVKSTCPDTFWTYVDSCLNTDISSHELASHIVLQFLSLDIKLNKCLRRCYIFICFAADKITNIVSRSLYAEKYTSGKLSWLPKWLMMQLMCESKHHLRIAHY